MTIFQSVIPHRAGKQNSESVFLVDTNIISESAPAKSATPSDLASWMDKNSSLLFLSAVTIAEIEDGIAKARREKATRKAGNLASWLETVIHLYSDRILVFDVEVARISGRLSDKARGAGHAPGFADIVIAATAEFHQLSILTRNLRHFQPMQVQTFDPFLRLPPTVV